MKVFITVLIVLSSGHSLYAQQQDFIRWNISATKVNDSTYEAHIAARIAAPWHIYSQHMDAGAGFPTQITYTKNPLVVITPNAREEGKLVTQQDPTTGSTLAYYSGIVTFVQPVMLKAAARTRINGSIEYMLCSDERCMPPAVKNFSVIVGN